MTSWQLWLDNLIHKQQKCSLRVLDTVFIGDKEGEYHWYYTTKNGVLAKKKADKCTKDEISLRFQRFALANPNNTEGIIAILDDDTSNRSYLRADELITWLGSTSRAEAVSKYLQVYLRPHEGIHQFIVFNYTCINKTENKEVWLYTANGTWAGLDSVPNRDFVQSQVTTFSEEIIASFQRNTAQQIQSLSTNFIIDDNGHVWLTNMTNLSLRETPDEPPLLPELPPSSRRGQSRESRPSSSESIFYRSNNVYRCQLGPDDLPGLRAWILDSINSTSGNMWTINLQDYTTPLKHSRELEKLRHERSQQKKSISASMLALLLQSEPLLLGRIPVSTVAEFKHRWRTYHHEATHTTSATQEVYVCGNCHAIAAKLQSLAKNNFDHMEVNTNVVLLSRPSSDIGTRPPSQSKGTIQRSGSSPVVGDEPITEKQTKTAPPPKKQVKRGPKKNAPSGSKKSSVPKMIPPDINMIAKFAAEKDRQQRLLQEQAAAAEAVPGEQFFESPLEDSFHSSYDDDVINEKFQSLKKRAAQQKPSKRKQQMSDEERLLEYERMAALNSKSLISNDWNMSTRSVMSGTEEQFMMRQATAGDVSQLIEKEGGLNDKMMVTLKERVIELEKQVASLGKQNKAKDDENSKLTQRLRAVNSDYNDLRTRSKKETQEMINKYEMEILAMKEQHAVQLAEYSAQPPVPTEVVSDNSTYILMEQIERLRNELRKQGDVFVNERNALQADLMLKIRTAERKMRDDEHMFRETITELEDKQEKLRDETQQWHNKYEQARKENLVLEQANAEALNTQQKLRADLKNIQQSVNASYRLDSTQAVGIGVDADTAIRLAEAKFEAKERQLSNSLEFVKSQLAAEVATVEEMKREVENAQAKQDSIRQEYKMRLQEAERIRQQDIESAEQRVEQRYEMRMSELTTLQSKFTLMQSQLQDAVHDNEAAKQREQIAKNASSKAQAHVISLKAEIEQLRNEVFELREKSDDTSKEGSKQNQDSLMRRLDNERQYLKSQLASEITHKNELQTALSQCQQQLADIQKQWAEDVDTLKDLRASETDRALHTEQRLSQHITGMATEIEQLKKSNEDLKNGYVKMRDQLRHEQLAVQNTNQLVDRLRDDLSIKMQEVQRLKDAEVSNGELFTAQINAIKQSMQELEQKKNFEIMRLKEDIKAQFMTNSELQKDTMVQRHEFQRDQLRINMKLEAIKIFGCFHRWKSVRLGSFFKTWYVKSTLIAVAKQYRENLNATIAMKDRETATAKQEALQELEDKLRAEHADILQTREEAMRLDHSEAIEHIHEEYTAKLAQLEEINENKLRKRDTYYKSEMSEKQEAFDSQLESEREKRKIQLEEQKQRYKKDLQQHVDSLEQKFYAEKIDVASQVTEEWKSKLAAREGELLESHESDIANIRLVHHQELQENTNCLLAKQKEEIAALHASYAEKEKILLNEFDNKYAELHHNLQQKEVNALNYLQSQHEEILQSMRERSSEIQESRIRDLRVEWDAEMNDLLAKKDSEIEKIVAKRAEELEVQFETKKAKLQKLEASKWQQMLKDMEKRYSLEMQQAKQLGYNECEATLGKREEEMSANHAMAISLIESKHQQFVSELNNSHDQALAELKQSLEIRMEEAIHAEKEQLRKQLLIEEAENHRISLEKAKAEVEFIWKGRLNKEQNRLESLKQDLQRNLANYAEEKRTHQQRVDHLENRCQRLEDSCKAELTDCKDEHEKEKTILQKSFDKQLKAALAEVEAKHSHSLQSTISHWKDEIQIQIDITREKVENQYHEQMKRIQDENDRLISGLESAMDVLKKEKSSLVQELESAMTKLENTEDALYDLQQAYRSLEKKNSFIVWKAAAKFVSMGLKFRTELQKSERSLAEKFAITNDDTMSKLEAVIMVGMKLSNLIVDMEKSRRGMHQVLSSYKTEVLIEKRTQIRLFEKELDRLVEERDVLEEQREALEDDITELQEQVREIEEQIREHNHASSVMPNGRINVAHARKKKRMDTELERILDLIEQKRTQCTALDERILNMNKLKDDKEGELIETEKTLVQVLIEQQRMVLNAVEDAKSIEEKGKVLIKMSCLPWPPPESPSEDDIKLAMA